MHNLRQLMRPLMALLGYPPELRDLGPTCANSCAGEAARKTTSATRNQGRAWCDSTEHHMSQDIKGSVRSCW